MNENSKRDHHWLKCGLDVPEEFFGHIKLMMGKLLRIKNNYKWSLTARTTEHAVEAHFDSFFIH